MSSAEPETVYLVGSGPGDPGLMTQRSLELVAACDCIVYDRLIPPGALAGRRTDCELYYVGKRPGGSMRQDEINALLVDLAQAKKSVLRLKGGDPFVFGRGGEEASALAEAGVRHEVVPGVTAGVAAPAYAGIPVTHRDTASAVAFVTGHRQPDALESGRDLRALAVFDGTLVFYMAVADLSNIVAELIAGGRSPDEPSAAISAGTFPNQTTVEAPLARLAESCERASLAAPAIIVIGAVASLRTTLAWFEKRPLFGTRVIVTRARAQASELSARLRGLGAEVIEAPAIRIDPLPVEGELRAALDKIEDYGLVCVTSPNGAALLFDGLRAVGRDARALANARVAAIGPQTGRVLAERGIIADIVPGRSVAEALADELSTLELRGERVLIARAAVARDVLDEALASLGASVDTVALYETVAEPLESTQLHDLATFDYVTFTSSSTVRYFLQALGNAGLCLGAKVVSIGPVTSATAREHGLEVAIEATQHDIEGLVAALIEGAGKHA